MTHYIHIDEPARPRRLPRAWRNVSGLDAMARDDLAALGWLPWVASPQPDHDLIHERLESGVEIGPDAATQTWAVVRRDDVPSVASLAAAQVAAIKADCGQAIEAVMPLWRQNNLMARAIELLDIRRDRPLVEDEAVHRDAITAAREWLLRQRAESDRLEALIAGIVAGDDGDDDKRTAIAAISFAPVP